MDSKLLRATTAIVLALSTLGLHPSGVWAQTEQAECPADWDWSGNSLGQDPCHIAPLLDADCRGIGIYGVPPLNASQNYSPPQRDGSSDLICDCNSIMYSLYMGCTACQGGVIYSWTRWIAECDDVYITQYPHHIPQGTAIPYWAFYNVSTLPDQTYDATVALSIGRYPEATPTTAGGNGTNTTKPGSGGRSNTGAIAGGVVGGVVSLIVLVVGVFLYMKKRKRGGGKQLPPLPPHSKEVSEHSEGKPTSPVFSTASTTLPGSPYSPGDQLALQSSLTYENPASPGRRPYGLGRGQYRGTAEV